VGRRRFGAKASLSAWLTPASATSALAWVASPAWVTSRAWVASLASLGSLALSACSSGLPHPPYAPQPTSALVEVAFPPPPARAEAVPPRPPRPYGADGPIVWLDGEWTWRGRRWSWTPGRWVVAPPDARFSPWTTVMREDGATFYAPGVWRDAHGAPLAEPPKALAYAQASSGVIFEPTGDLQRTGPTIDPTRQRRQRRRPDADADADAGAGAGAGASPGATADAGVGTAAEADTETETETETDADADADAETDGGT
jgi:hypothetical protein